MTILNASSNNPIPGATVNYVGGTAKITDANGKTTFNSVPAGVSTTFTASAPNFTSSSVSFIPVANSSSSLTLSLAPIVACSSTQIAGYDTPDKRFVNLGKTSGTFSFNYETYQVKDRIIVSNEGGVLFDTGCVGTNGNKKTVSIGYSGSVNKGVTVEVKPNCEGINNTTEWNYKVSCPQ